MSVPSHLLKGVSTATSAPMPALFLFPLLLLIKDCSKLGFPALSPLSRSLGTLQKAVRNSSVPGLRAAGLVLLALSRL